MNGSNQAPLALLFDYATCREVDRHTIAAGIPEQQLMGQAALASVHALLPLIETRFSEGGRLVVLCGTGNNGGDGYAFVYMLAGAVPRAVQAITIIAAAPPRSAAAIFYAEQARALGVSILPGSELTADAFGPGDIVVEALLGIGQSEPPRGVTADMLRALAVACTKHPRLYLAALDVPVGLFEESPVIFTRMGSTPERQTRGDAFAPPTYPLPNEIHSYGVEKLALRLQPQLAAGARIRVLPMGFLPTAITAPGAGRAPARLLRSKSPATMLARRPLDHKYSAGHALLGGGSAGMEGALLLCARAFFAAGGGIVHAFSNAEANATWGAYPAVMFQKIAQLSSGATPAVVAIGSGTSDDESTALADQVIRLFERARTERALPPLLIVDAGCLPHAARIAGALTESERKRMLLTPHTGEWVRLGGPNPDCTSALYRAADFLRKNFGCYALVKGAVSTLLGPNEETYVFSEPNAALAVAGSGDILLGILAAIGARRTDSSTDSLLELPEIVALALGVHNGAAGRRVNPDAVQLIEGIRSLVGDSSAG